MGWSTAAMRSTPDRGTGTGCRRLRSKMALRRHRPTDRTLPPLPQSSRSCTAQKSYRLNDCFAGKPDLGLSAFADAAFASICGRVFAVSQPMSSKPPLPASFLGVNQFIRKSFLRHRYTSLLPEMYPKIRIRFGPVSGVKTKSQRSF